ncbi:GntP family permease [Salinicola halophilus]|uniref:GntP family permease n=1 Tax=Salinicola halophilus TaxID=184065 RepID=UPI000DA1B913|nr:GntP family permease [Salinicola halophilus]
MSDLYVLIAFGVALVAMILMISRWNVHPAITLLIIVVGLGLALGLGVEESLNTLSNGLGSTVGKVGMIIFLGCVLGKMLEGSGAALRITSAAYNAFGPKKAIWAIAAASALLGVPIFSDAIVIVLMPIVANLAMQTNTSMAKYGTVLYLGAFVTASAIPPTPGPVAAASFLGVSMGEAILWGALISVPGIIAGTLYAQSLKIDVAPKPEYLQQKPVEEGPSMSLLAAVAPIVLPIMLMMFGSLVGEQFEGSWLGEFLALISDPTIALLIGVVLAFPLLGGKWRTKEVLNDWMEDGLRLAAMPIIVTGLGGALALIVRDTGVADSLASSVQSMGIPPLLIPFIVGALVNTITGSNTLGVLTSASIVQPLLPSLDISPLAAFLACASGSQILKHPNSSGFWVTVSLSGMNVAQGIRAVGGATLISGLVSGAFTYFFFIMGWV